MTFHVGIEVTERIGRSDSVLFNGNVLEEEGVEGVLGSGPFDKVGVAGDEGVDSGEGDSDGVGSGGSLAEVCGFVAFDDGIVEGIGCVGELVFGEAEGESEGPEDGVFLNGCHDGETTEGSTN